MQILIEIFEKLTFFSGRGLASFPDPSLSREGYLLPTPHPCPYKAFWIRPCIPHNSGQNYTISYSLLIVKTILYTGGRGHDY